MACVAGGTARVLQGVTKARGCLSTCPCVCSHGQLQLTRVQQWLLECRSSAELVRTNCVHAEDELTCQQGVMGCLGCPNHHIQRLILGNPSLLVWCKMGKDSQ
eukprot:scaffold284076_cov18-Tisochrysis_lutea.AAC.1